jgi:hypothetical protein
MQIDKNSFPLKKINVALGNIELMSMRADHSFSDFCPW